VRQKRCALAGVLTLAWMVTSLALAADHKLETVAGRLIFNVDANWTLVDELPEDMEGAVGFRVGDGSSMQWLVSPANEHGQALKSAADVRELTLYLREEVESQGGEIAGGLVPIQGPRARGFYLKAVDPAPGPGEWKYMYTGWVSVDSHPVMFNIVWNAGGQSSADRALESVKSMRLQR
jgi:hypothetical protein